MLVRLLARDGSIGYGEAAPLEGATAAEVGAALERCGRLLAEHDGEDHDELLAACRREGVPPQAIAALDLALWDLAGRRAGRPVWQLLGAAGADPVTVNFTIASSERADASREAAAARAAGFRCVKVKVGIGDDAARLGAVRAAGGPDMKIRIDANGAWSRSAAEASLRELEKAGLELCEEPVRGLEALDELPARTSVPLAIDESAALPGALDRRLCTAVCLKIARFGGISGVLNAARRARAAGYEVYLASMLDGPLGIAAALHAAAVVAPDRPCGLATLPLFEEREDPLPALRGKIAVPGDAGLGDGLLAWYGVSRR